LGKRDWGTKFFLPKLSWDEEIVEAHENESAMMESSFLAESVARQRVVAKDLIAPVLEALLHPHVLDIVCEFFLSWVHPKY